MRSVVIIPAGGSGKRFGSQIPKQFLMLHGKEIIIRTLEVFQNSPDIDEIVIASHPDWIEFLGELIEKYQPSKVKEIVRGGKERQDSVHNALLSHTASNANLIFVHDAVRPFISLEVITKLKQEAELHGSAIPFVPPKNTIKSISGDFSDKTLNRNELCEVHTPQVFKRELLIQSFNYAYSINYYGTDSSSLLELIGIKSKLVLDSYDNIKITTATDLETAELILENFPRD